MLFLLTEMQSILYIHCIKLKHERSIFISIFYVFNKIDSVNIYVINGK